MTLERFPNTNLSIRITHFLLFLFPVVALTVKNGGSAVVTFLFIIALVTSSRDIRNIEVWERRLFIGFILLFLVMAVSLAVTEDLVTGLKRLERYFRWLAAIPVYLLVRKCPSRLRAITMGVLVSTILVAGEAIVQVYIKGHASASGPYNPIIFGEYAVFAGAFLIAYLLYFGKSKIEYFIYGVGIFLSFYAAALSGARGAWIAIPAIAGLVAWRARRRLGFRAILGLIGSFLVVVVLAVSFSSIGPRFHQAVLEFESYSVESGDISSTAQRLNMWRNSIEIFRKSPLIGTGIGDFRKDTQQLIAEGKTSSTLEFDHAHSIYFDALAVSGIIGFVATIGSLFYLPLRSFVQKPMNGESNADGFASTAGVMLVVGFAIFGLTEVWLIRNPALNVYIVFMLVLLAEKKQSLKSSTK